MQVADPDQGTVVGRTGCPQPPIHLERLELPRDRGLCGEAKLVGLPLVDRRLAGRDIREILCVGLVPRDALIEPVEITQRG